jgi:lipopolysaccharide export system permease protein
MRLGLYVARRFVITFAAVFTAFFLMMMLIDMVEQVRRFSDISVRFASIVGLAALNVPGSLYRILPLIMVLSAISLFLSLSRSSELVVIRAAGLSLIRLLLTPFAVALLIGIGAVLVMNPLVAATSKRYQELSSNYSSGSDSALSISPEGLWLRQGEDGQQTVIHAVRANQDGTTLYDVSFLGFDGEGRPLARVNAAEASLVPGAWVLRNVKRWDLEAPNPEATAQILPEYRIVTELTRDRIRDSVGSPSTIAIWDLPSFIADLDRAGFSARKQRVWLQMELALPLLLSGMVLLAAGFTMRHARSGRTGALVLAAVLAGFGIFFLRNFAQVLGESGQIPVYLAAWSAPIATVLMSLGLLLHLEDG